MHSLNTTEVYSLLYVYADAETDVSSPDVVILAEDHASFAVAGAAVLSQLSVAAGALEAACVPVLFHGEEQEAVCDSTSASCARPACCPPAASAHYCYCGRLHPAVHHSDLEKGRETKEKKD